MDLINCIVALSLATALLQEPADVRGEERDHQELARLEAVWNKAHLHGNADVLDRLWAEDLAVTVPNMQVMTKPEAMSVWRSGRLRFQRYETSDIRVRTYADAAIVTGRLHRTRIVNGREMQDDWRFTKVYVRQTGAWRVVAWHGSPAAQ